MTSWANKYKWQTTDIGIGFTFWKGHPNNVFINCSFFKSESCIRTELKNFEMNFNRLLQDQEFKRELTNRGKKYVSNYLSNPGDASRKLIEFSVK